VTPGGEAAVDRLSRNVTVPPGFTLRTERKETRSGGPMVALLCGPAEQVLRPLLRLRMPLVAEVLKRQLCFASLDVSRSLTGRSSATPPAPHTRLSRVVPAFASSISSRSAPWWRSSD
jgi:hypothetical protein